MKELKSNEFWGKRSGKFETKTPKGSNVPFGNCFPQMQWGSGANRSIARPQLKTLGINRKWAKGYKNKG